MRSARDAIAAENKSLKKRLELAERENAELKRSVYELSTRLSAALAATRSPTGARGAPIPPLGAEGGAAEEGAASGAGAQEGRSVSSPKGRPLHHLKRAAAEPDGRPFALQLDLKGHTGAVYTLRFSPSGRLLASGSFDHTVRCWSRGEEVACLRDHAHNVSDVCWSADSTYLLSGSFDHTVRLWDVARAECVSAFEAGRAFVLSVTMHSADVLTAATSAGQLLQFDRRRGDKPTLVLRNDCMVNSVVQTAEQLLLSGDKRGVLKAWDLRTGSCVRQQAVGDPPRPISHVELSPEVGWRGQHAARLRLCAINSYDDTLRVLTEGATADEGSAAATTAGSAALGTGGGCPSTGCRSAATAPADAAAEARGWRQLCELRGHKNRSWPIRSSFAAGEEWSRLLAEDEDAPSRWRTHDTAFIATGSTDGRAYVYALGNASSGVSGELLQTLDGHSDRVYATSFHPQELQLATCSADFLVKIWAA